ncbi:hypothetical protein [Nannocystis sp. SCPEA4]|uniref:hypothetical protein n=1 Tax=Nannocystis sp. SCPEA4 TaxID=2996787 RepID=UPI0022715AB9|nr:hypothetical protein [Nannocystis sp. SCPEA4]MCY1053792.1 hypothetical protein [Nannocystis sp. SCPEA4]
MKRFICALFALSLGFTAACAEQPGKKKEEGEAKTVDGKKTDAKSADAKPADAKPADAKPADAAPAPAPEAK